MSEADGNVPGRGSAREGGQPVICREGGQPVICSIPALFFPTILSRRIAKKADGTLHSAQHPFVFPAFSIRVY